MILLALFMSLHVHVEDYRSLKDTVQIGIVFLKWIKL